MDLGARSVRRWGVRSGGGPEGPRGVRRLRVRAPSVPSVSGPRGSWQVIAPDPHPVPPRQVVCGYGGLGECAPLTTSGAMCKGASRACGAVRARRSGARRRGTTAGAPGRAGRERMPAENGALRRRGKIRVPSGRKAAAHSAARASAPDECMRKALLGISLERSGRKRLFVRRGMGVVSAMSRRGPVPGREGRSGSSGQVGVVSSLGPKDSPLRPPEPVSPTPLSAEVDTPRFFGDCYGSRRPPVVITTTAIVRFFPPRNTAQPP